MKHLFIQYDHLRTQEKMRMKLKIELFIQVVMSHLKYYKSKEVKTNLNKILELFQDEYICLYY